MIYKGRGNKNERKVFMPRTIRRFGIKRINHIVIRGVNKQDIFLDNQDKSKFIKEILNTKEKYHYELYAFVIMPNHVHMLIYDKEFNLSVIMNSLQTRYVSYFNKKYERVGHLFQDRYFNKMIEDDNYLKSTIRYIHKNPEKAFLAKQENYEWSSYKQYMNNDNSIVNIDTFLKILDENKEIALKKFKEYHKQNEENKLSDGIEYELQTKLTDEQLIEALKEKLEINNIQNIQQYSNKKIIELLKEIVNIPYISINQLSRVTGINRKLLGKAKK